MPSTQQKVDLAQEFYGTFSDVVNREANRSSVRLPARMAEGLNWKGTDILHITKSDGGLKIDRLTTVSPEIEGKLDYCRENINS